MKTSPVTAALAVGELAGQGRFTEIQEQFAPQLRPIVPAEALQVAWEGELAKNGPVASVGTPVTEPAGRGGALVKVPMRFEHGALTVAVGLAGSRTGSPAFSRCRPARPNSRHRGRRHLRGPGYVH